MEATLIHQLYLVNSFYINSNEGFAISCLGRGGLELYSYDKLWTVQPRLFSNVQHTRRWTF